ncbi:hypothetical protein QOZ80_9BG0710940 [Eleusine coracana subsp. coracana]|nr:hypothetical protein QOZ80_9BG0710940 [Eleusine coracana subsp. coracana]
MDMTTSATIWFAIALASVITVITKVAIGRRTTTVASDSHLPHPPVVNGVSTIVVLYAFLTKGFRSTLRGLHTKLGSVFTVSFFGFKLTFLVGPEVSAHFYQGSDLEISHGNILEFTVPIIGKEVGYGTDAATRNDQHRFFHDVLKPSKVGSRIGPMTEEVQDYFAKWGEEGVVDLKQEFEQLLILISGRCLIGKEVRQKMYSEFFTLFGELIGNGMCLINVFLPYAPTLACRRRDMARANLSELFSKIVRSRKSTSVVEKDVLQSLIDSKYRDGKSTTEAQVIGMMISLLFAGKHTSSITSTWTGAHLLTDARSLKAVVNEQSEIMSKYGDLIDYNVLLQMNILHFCIKEALRMHPPSPVLVRKVHKNFSVRTKEGSEYEIPRGHTIASPTLYNSNIPDIYRDPNMYDPDRFGPARAEDTVGGKFSYTAFSGGRHACPGEALAYVQIKVIWSHLLRNFELKLLSPFPESDWWKIIVEPKGKVIVSYKRQQLCSS